MFELPEDSAEHQGAYKIGLLFPNIFKTRENHTTILIYLLVLNTNINIVFSYHDQISRNV